MANRIETVLGWGYIGWTPRPVIVIIRDNSIYIRVLLYVFLIYHYYRVRGPPKIYRGLSRFEAWGAGLWS